MPQPLDSVIRARIEPEIERLMAAHHLPGFAVGAANREGEIYARGFGVARLGGDQPITPLSIFHMASVTKPFVATALMQLAEQGRVSLDARVCDLLPEFRLADPRAGAITVRQMLNHTSGMPDVEDYGWDRPEYDDEALERYIRSLADQRLIGPPGGQYAYSNTAFEVLGALIARLTGMPFEDAVQAQILGPLGMRYSTLLHRRIDRSLLTSPHIDDEAGQVVVSPVFPYNRPHAASSTLTSNVTDMLRWARLNLRRGELDGRRILKESSCAELWKPSSPITGAAGPLASARCGLSWFVSELAGHRLVTHSGGDEGFHSHLVLAPDDDLALVAMSNYSPQTHYVRQFGFEAMGWLLGVA